MKSNEIWVIELEHKNPDGQMTGMMKAVCTSQTAARVWCIQFSDCYPGWKLEYNGDMISGLWNANSGDKLIIKPSKLYTQESTYLSSHGY